MVKSIHNTSEAFSWEVLPHASYSPDLAPSDYLFFASMGHAFVEQHFGSHEDVKKCLDEGWQQKEKIFIGVVIKNCPQDGKYV